MEELENVMTYANGQYTRVQIYLSSRNYISDNSKNASECENGEKKIRMRVKWDQLR